MLNYSVKTLREAGLEAKWSRNRRGAPIIVARNPKATNKHQRETYWYVSKDMWAAMERDGILNGFDQFTLLGDIFSVSV